MRVMVLVKATKSSETGEMPATEMFEAMDKYNEGLVKAGIMLSGDGLKPSSAGKRVEFAGGKRTVTDGPFAETKELLAGYWVWQVKSMEEAVAWVKRCPNPMPEDSIIEIRPFYEMEDFGDLITPEMVEQDERLRKEIAAYTLEPPRFETGRAMLFAGFNETYTFERRVNIPKQWERFAPHIGKVPGQIGKVSYGVCWNYVPGKGFDYMSAVEAEHARNLPDGFTSLEVAPQRYAVFTHAGHFSEIPKTIEAIWSKWLPNSGHEAAESPAFERYDETFCPDTGAGGIEVWVPLKK